ncbi:hypothetical protein AB0P21_19720 [Kribbella sp. NPDC056861]|uniref:hypothetical protein n=1 Tax=Kribbella sp. NPDC056861 TaxID=3154857 RepID=UPI003419BF82
MTTVEMDRTNIQVLWRHLPEQPFNWQGIASVIGRPPRQVSVLDVHEDWVAPMLHRLIEPFALAAVPGSGAGLGLDIIEHRAFELVKAESGQAERFPNTYLCRTCDSFRRVQLTDPPPGCAGHGPMKQLSYVEVHNCGHLAELQAPRCVRNCGAAMRLCNTDRFRTGKWFWLCSGCRQRSRMPVARRCQSCSAGNVQVIRVPKSSAYYPQQITVLNPPTRTQYDAVSHDSVYAAAIAQALEVLPPGLDELSAAGQAPQDPDDTVRQMAAKLQITADNPLFEAMLTQARVTTGRSQAWREEVDALELDGERLAALGEECRQLSLALDAGRLTAGELLTGAAGDSELVARYRGYQELFDRHGISDITLLRELPVAFVVAGYTRGSDRAVSSTPRGDAIATTFKFFEQGRSSRFPMYGIRTETEGLLVRLDPLRVVEWLVASGIVADPGPSSAAAARRWLFRAIDPVTSIFDPPDNQISKAVLALTHSVSHRFMKALAARCGLNVDSLAEYLFPSNTAFLIYANTRSEFILGGLEHVFRFDLADAMDELAAETRCVFDPPCREAGGGACAACLYVFEATCCRFNTVLDRNTLFGSIPPPPGAENPAVISWQAFWPR